MVSENKNYFGFNPPSLNPELFAPKLIGTQHHEHSAPTFSLDGTEIYWSRYFKSDEERPQTIVMMKFERNSWSSPIIAPFSGKHHDGGPIFSYDEDLLYFYSMPSHLPPFFAAFFASCSAKAFWANFRFTSQTGPRILGKSGRIQ